MARYADAEPLYQALAGDPREGARPGPSRCRRESLNNLAVALREPRPLRRRVAAGTTADRQWARRAVCRSSGAVRCSRNNLISGRESTGRQPQRGPARHPDLGGVRHQQARRSPGRRQRPACHNSFARTRTSPPRRRRWTKQSLRPCPRSRPSAIPPPSSGSRQRLAAIAGERNALQKVFASEFPDYAALSNPLPLTAKEVQALLSDDEALVLFAAAGTDSPSDKKSYVFALTREGFDWKSIPLGGDALAAKVAAFRRGLDVDMVADQDYARRHQDKARAVRSRRCQRALHARSSVRSKR